MRKFFVHLFYFWVIVFVPEITLGQASELPVKDPSFKMEIPGITAMAASEAHLYILSNKEGLAVFRTNTDTLQWLYTSDGMQRRGNQISADIRFAYLHGNGNRLTVVEPTSLLGVYSSTRLNGGIIDAARIENNLYVASSGKGLTALSLASPAAVDSVNQNVNIEDLKNSTIIDLEPSGRQLFILTDQSELHQVVLNDGNLSSTNQWKLGRPIQKLFEANEQLLGTTDAGDIFQISSTGNVNILFEVKEPVDTILYWQNNWVIRTTSGKVWISVDGQEVIPWKDDTKAGNYITKSKDLLFLVEYDKVFRIVSPTSKSDNLENSAQVTSSEELRLKPIENKMLPYPKPLLIPLELERKMPVYAVTFSQRSNVEGITIRGNSVYWQPGQDDVGKHRITIIASTLDNRTDSTTFSVDIRPFNAPPRFSPIRPMKIGVDESFTLPINAFDPDGNNRKLIRYMGVDMPQGAKIDEQSGLFSWQPTLRQTGKHSFKIIATDQFGAAAAKDVTLTVIEERRE